MPQCAFDTAKALETMAIITDYSVLNAYVQ